MRLWNRRGSDVEVQKLNLFVHSCKNVNVQYPPNYQVHPPFFSAFLWHYVSQKKCRYYPNGLGQIFFLLFLSRSNNDLHFLRTQNCCRINPHGATVSFIYQVHPVFPHMRRVKYGIFKNIQKILKIKLKSFFLCQKMQNSSLFTNIQNDLQ